MYEVRFHGRGGQGAVMAAQALANAAFVEGNYAVSFPYFGAERRGAPVLAFARVDPKKIRVKTQVYNPDYVVVLDERLIETVNIAEGLKVDGMAILNSKLKPEDVDLGMKVDTATVDATSIALDVLGSPITNSAILGAFAYATKLLSIESIEEGIRIVFGARIGEKAGKMNAMAARKAYENTSIGKSQGKKVLESQKKWLPDYKELPLGIATRAESKSEGLIGPGSFTDNKTGTWRTFMPELDQEKCNMCLICWFYCPEGCMEREDEKLNIIYDYCKGCGVCEEVCPKEAIKMERDVVKEEG
jgi:2-oxoacid:acceptor oxidoreductase gamma subunit (pyruvate/2-ketoisovalerate family)/2-oxoacid:acceptor oxidoreductase delta subunit (pyruvate/2-ketoisovalerate family)